MARVRNYCSTSKPAIWIWLISALTFYFLFLMATRNSTEWSISIAEQRSRLYEKMEKDLEDHGATFLKQGETTQSLSLSDLFILKDGVVTPVLKAANPPVRANVLYLNTEYSVPIAEAVRSIFSPHFDKEIEAEANAVRAVSESICPLKIALDRVVLTSTGVLVGCWQVDYGSDPVTIRQKLRNALPHAPAKQLYDAVMLHTSFARLLGHPSSWPEKANKVSELQFLHELVNRLNNKIRGTKGAVGELWYVEEYDILALALNGRMKVRKFQLGCSKV